MRGDKLQLDEGVFQDSCFLTYSLQLLVPLQMEGLHILTKSSDDIILLANGDILLRESNVFLTESEVLLLNNFVRTPDGQHQGVNLGIMGLESALTVFQSEMKLLDGVCRICLKLVVGLHQLGYQNWELKCLRR